jgi:DNA invertase Pin-like site-specific DNA recombinase
MNVVLYARVSSEKQAEKDLSISSQLKAMRKYAYAHSWEICQEFIDEAESARTANRPSFQNMISIAKQKPKLFDAILVWKLSRFARNREDSIIYKALLRRRGISVISINEKLDDSPSGKMLEGIIEVMDEFYSANLAQDTMRGLKENASRGFRNGGVSPMGYKTKKAVIGANKKSILEVDENFSPIIKRIFNMFVNGMGAKEIVNKLNTEGIKTNKDKIWSKNVIYYILKNEVYTGTLVWNRKAKNQYKANSNNTNEVIRIENKYPAIIDKKTFFDTQSLLKERSLKITSPRTISSKYLLSGLLFCGNCGSRMVGCAAKSSQHFYYACNSYCKKGKNICNAKLLNKNRIETFIINRIKANILTKKNLEELVKLTNKELIQNKTEYKNQLDVLDRQLADLIKRCGKLYNVLETGKLDIEYLAPRIKELKSQIDILKEKRVKIVENINTTEIKTLKSSEIKEYVSDLKNLLSNGTIIEQKSFIKSFIKRIEINLPKVIIDYTVPLKIKKAEHITKEVLSLELFG